MTGNNNPIRQANIWRENVLGERCLGVNVINSGNSYRLDLTPRTVDLRTHPGKILQPWPAQGISIAGVHAAGKEVLQA